MINSRPSTNAGLKDIGLLATSLILFVWFILLHFPVAISLQGNLDPSWQLMLNWSFKNNLAFGKDVFFTYGPLGFFANPIIPELVTVASLLYLVAIPVIGYPIISRKSWLLPASFVFILCTSHIDAFNLIQSLFPVAVITSFLKFKNKRQQSYYLIYAAFIGGLLSCVKFTFFISATPAIIAADIMLWKRHRSIIASPFFIITFCLTLVAFGTPLPNIYDFLAKSFALSSGYSEAMIATVQFPGLLFALSILIIIATAASFIFSVAHAQNDNTLTFLSTICCGCSLFLAFKHGFVRHDGHVFSTFITLLAISAYTLLILVYTKRPNWKKLALPTLSLLLACSVPYMIFRDYLSISSATAKAAHSITQFNKHSIEFDKRLKQLAKFDISRFNNATVDTYPWDISEVVASKLNYAPRPIPQSYTAYTPELLKLNRDHLLGRNAPRYLLWTVKTIDNRLPSLMDGLSWPVVLANYMPDGNGKLPDQIVLKMKTTTKEAPKRTLIGEATAKFNQPIAIPKSAPLVWATIDMNYSLLGKFMKLIWRTSTVSIKLTAILPNGSKRILQHRLIPGMSKTTFLLSPYIANTQDFTELYGYKTGIADTLPRIESISLSRHFISSNHITEIPVCDYLAVHGIINKISIKFYSIKL